MQLSRLIAPTLAALGGAAVLAAPTEAEASGGVVAVSPGLTFTVSLGQKISFGLGLDLRVTGLIEGKIGGCNRDSRRGVGAFAQATWLNFSAWRFAAGAHGGGEVVNQIIAVDGEVGWTYRTRFGDAFPGYHGLHLGMAGAFTLGLPVPSLEVPVRLAIPMTGRVRTPEVTTGLGVRWPQMYGFPNSGCIEGRPLRADGEILRAGVAIGRERRLRDARLDRGTREAIAGAWTEDARSECASISAFLALARDLVAGGAPPALAERAIRAAEEEVRHTAMCAAIAGGHAGFEVDPLLIDPPPAKDADRRDALLRMALEAWFDGCINEGAAAERAARAGRAATDGAARAAQAAIAVDERGHAELGWSVLEHCLAAGGSEIRDALAEAVAMPEAEPPRVDPAQDADPSALRAHGRLAQRDADVAFRETVATSRRRAAALLSAA